MGTIGKTDTDVRRSGKLKRMELPDIRVITEAQKTVIMLPLISLLTAVIQWEKSLTRSTGTAG